MGGIVGGLSLFGILKLSNVAVLGNACNYAPEVSVGGIIGAVLVEIILTAIFVYTILNVTDENSGAGKKAGLIIGLTLTLVHLVGINITGDCYNDQTVLNIAYALESKMDYKNQIAKEVE